MKDWEDGEGNMVGWEPTLEEQREDDDLRELQEARRRAHERQVAVAHPAGGLPHATANADRDAGIRLRTKLVAELRSQRVGGR